MAIKLDQLRFDDDVDAVISASLCINIASVNAILTDLSPRASVCVCVCVSVGKVYCGKTADWIRMPFGVVSGIGRGIGVLDGGGDRRRERGSFGGKFVASQ